MVKNSKLININYYNLKLSKINSRSIIGLIVLLTLILLYIKNYINHNFSSKLSNNRTYERILVFLIIFLLLIVLSHNLIISIVISVILFLLINLLMNYRYTLENFQNDEGNKEINELSKETKKTEIDITKDEPSFDKNIFDTDVFKQSTNGIQELLKKVNGGIELKDDDTKETQKLGIDTTKYSDDNKLNPLKQAQKEAYELIDTVNALKDTVTTLAPVLSEGKKLMDIFQNLKL